MAAGLGHIELIIGPMFSGKTTELLRRIRRYSVTQRRCLVVKHRKDTRYSDTECATHDRHVHVAIPCELLGDLEQEFAAYDVIGIDEGQFFADIVTMADKLATAGKIVIVAALDGTFQRKPFGSVLELIPVAEQVDKLHAVCQLCFRDAAFTRRLGDEQQMVELIGGADLYAAVCRNCLAPRLPVAGAAMSP